MGLVGASLSLIAAPLGQAQTTDAHVPVTPPLEVSGEPVPTPTPQDDTRPKLNHIMKEVSGTEITVTKKATVIKLDQQPTVINNNQQEIFSKAPGLLITEQQTPGQFNISYRGLGNPQESEYILGLQDRVPIMTDWIGFPTLYYTPLPQSISEIQVIRGGSSLLYGPEPAPAINYVTKRPPGSPLSGYTEQVGGGYGTYSTFNVLQGTQGPLEFRTDFGYVHSDGQRDNSESNLFQGDIYVGYRPDSAQLWSLDFHAYHVSVGDPGRLTIQQYDLDPNFSPTPYNHDWVDRYNVTLSHEHDFGDGWLFEGKAWFTYQAVDNRSAAALGPDGELPATTTIQAENYYNGGADLRLRKLWGDNTLFRGSALTFGGVVYHGEAPFMQFISPDLFADRNDTGVSTRLDQDRSTDYQAFFAENIFRLGPFHVVPSFRLDHETVDVTENVTPFERPLADASADRWVPLWGIGLGNDFCHGNESYFSASSGWRPTRFFDVVSPFSPTFVPGHPSDPFKSLDFELGVHGTPQAVPGLWYDVGLFWMEFSNRTETAFLNPGVNNDTILINSGSTRHRGFEGEVAYDLLQLFGTPALGGNHLTVSGNLQWLDAEFTESDTRTRLGRNRPLPRNGWSRRPLLLAKTNAITFA